MQTLTTFIGNVIQFIIYPLVFLLFALGLYFLVFGVATFILKADDPKAREIGRKHLLWGVFGMFIMVMVVSIISVLTNTFCGAPFCSNYRILP